MTVLLIDLSGHVREYDVPELWPTIRVPIPRSTASVWRNETADVTKPTYGIADFDRSPEPSWPPVYRQRSFSY
jgi:hypothetical protein